MRSLPIFIAVGIAICLLASTARSADTAPPDNAATYYRQAFEALPSGEDVDRAFNDWQTVPFDGPTIKILRRCDAAIELMQRGASMKKCDWELDYSKGLDLQIPELRQARRMTYAASLKIRYLCEVKRYERVAAISADLMTMGRHVSTQLVFVGRLIGIAVEESAIHVAARYLPELPPPITQQLLDRLANLPGVTPLSDTLRSEGKMTAITIRIGKVPGGEASSSDLPKDPAARAELAKQVEAAWNQAAKEVAEPLHDLPATQAKLQAIVDATPPAATPLVKGLAMLPRLDCMVAADRALLRAAIAVAQKGPDAAKAYHDPFGSGPITCEPIDGGYKLSSALLPKDSEPQSLKTGPHAYDD
ncbi:MAG: hypothetical protein JWP03_5102 [Phycisphaerales bacterium]|nr:hypothetical protein [Phycisphaerales bacterium]